jgi:hypothetical protein
MELLGITLGQFSNTHSQKANTANKAIPNLNKSEV